MSLTPDDVSRIAHLARLELSPPEGAAMLAQLNDFFRIVEQMSAVDTSGLEPLHTPLSAIGEVALLATSATESSILVDYGWVMLVICIVNASQNMSWRSALPRTARQLR